MAKKIEPEKEGEFISTNPLAFKNYFDEYVRNTVPNFELYNTLTKFHDAVNSVSKFSELQRALSGTKKAISEKINIKSESKKNYEKEININFLDEKLVLVLGAGISMTYGLPSWKILLQKLMVKTITTNDDSDLIAELFTFIFSPNPIIAGRYLQKHFEDKKILFEEEVRKALYEEIDLNKESKTMDEIVKFCIAAGKSPNLNSIITYNFDDLLEQNIDKLNMDLPYRSIYGVGQEILPSELPIYHVHGFLPHSGELSESNQITFGESFYHQQYIDIYSWNNIVQINKFRENNCLFIGTSLTDPNTRRLLDIANQQRIKRNGSHYIIKPKYNREYILNGLKKWIEENGKEKIKEEEFDNFVETLTTTIEGFEENDFQSLGVKTIWVESYDDIPKVLAKIRNYKE